MKKKQWLLLVSTLICSSTLLATRLDAEQTTVDVSSTETVDSNTTTDDEGTSEDTTQEDTTSEENTTSTDESSSENTTTSSSNEVVDKPANHAHKAKNLRVRVTKQTTLYTHDAILNHQTNTKGVGQAKVDQIFKATAMCTIDNKVYYQVERNNMKGWLPASNVTSFNKVSMKATLLTGINDYKAYRDFDWSQKGTVSVGRVYQTDGYYQFGDGSKYYSLYREDSKGKRYWCGYANAKSFRSLKMTKKSQLVTGTKTYDCYSNFYWKKRGQISKGTVYHSPGYYTLGNGEKYYSVYREDSKGKRHWYGYANVKSFRSLKMTKKSQLVTGTKTYDRYSNFYWKKRGQISKGTVYHSPGYYTLGNGKKYYSVYREDSKGKRHWYGYANTQSFRTLTMKKQNKMMKVKAEYKRYSNFFWKYRGKASVGKIYQIKGYYTLGNGTKYYSLYDNKGGWYGYVNAKALKDLGHEDFYFSQRAKEWNKYKVRYTTSTIYDIGCAPTSLAMAMNIMRNQLNYTNPWKMADAMARYGVLRDYGTDASYNVLPNVLNALGFKSRYISVSDNVILGALKKNHMVLLNGAGYNPFTAYDHFILASDISKDGKKAFILDPWQKSNNGWWSVKTLRKAGLCRAFEIWI